MTGDNKIRKIDYVAGVDELLERIQKLSTQLTSYKDAELFASYLRRRQKAHDITVDNLANELNCPTVYLNLLLQAKIPAMKIDRIFLETVAEVFQDDIAMVFSLVGQLYYSEDTRDDVIYANQKFSEYILSEVNNILFATIDERYADDNTAPETYDKVITELQRIIARQRRDLRFIEGLLEGLENPALSQMLSKELTNFTIDPAERTLAHVRRNLERIVSYLNGDEPHIEPSDDIDRDTITRIVVAMLGGRLPQKSKRKPVSPNNINDNNERVS